MQALLVVDAQNEFSANGQRAVLNHESAVQRIRELVQEARDVQRPIAWIQHHNKPNESRAFIPGSWGAELTPGFGPRPGFGREALFQKDVFGAFSATGLEQWLRELGVTELVLTGFYTHMCVSTTARQGLVRGFDVTVEFDATGACALRHELLGEQTADEVRLSAPLQLSNMGVVVRRPSTPGRVRLPIASMSALQSV